MSGKVMVWRVGFIPYSMASVPALGDRNMVRTSSLVLASLKRPVLSAWKGGWIAIWKRSRSVAQLPVVG